MFSKTAELLLFYNPKEYELLTCQNKQKKRTRNYHSSSSSCLFRTGLSEPPISSLRAANRGSPVIKYNYYYTIMSFYHIRSREDAKHEFYNRANTGGSNKEHLTGFRVDFGYSYQKIEAKITIFFCSRIINLSFNGWTYNTRQHFVHC